MKTTDEQLREWAARHSLDGWCLTDLRCAYEDAASHAEIQARLGWERAAEKGRAHEEALKERDTARELHANAIHLLNQESLKLVAALDEIEGRKIAEAQGLQYSYSSDLSSLRAARQKEPTP